MITCITTSMGRRNHLEVTLPFMMREFDCVIVVDYNCPQGSGEYARSEGALVVNHYGAKYYNGSKAKNLGAFAADSDYLCFVDADSLCMPGLRKDLKSLVRHDRMVLSARDLHGQDVNDTVGFLACPTVNFWRVCGFDEHLWQGWGHEDIHLRGKLFLDERLKVARLSPMVLGSIPHGNELRSEHRERPIVETAIEGFHKMRDWFASKGIPDYPTNPAIQDIAFHGQHPSV